MKRYLISLVLSALGMLIVVAPVLGIAYPNGQQHYYSVLLRGNGEAVVSFKAHFSNIDGDAVRTVLLHAPTSDISDVSAYQVRTQFEPKPCYPPVYDLQKSSSIEPLPVTITPTPTPFDRPTVGSTLPSPTMMMPCYGYPDYYNSYNVYGNHYDKAQVAVSGDTISIDLPTPVVSGEEGNYFLTFRTNGFVHKTLVGALSFAFKTLTIDAPISDLQVGIATDENFILKDATGSINYNGTAITSSVLPLPVGGTQSSALDTYYNQIGQGTVYKTAAHLSPHESFSVSGLYANQTWKLYGKEISIGFSVLVLLAILFVLGVRFLLHRLHDKQVDLASKRHSITSKLFADYLLGSIAGIGFFAAVLTVLYTIVLFVLAGLFGPIIPYSDFQALVFLLVVLFSIGVYVLCLFGPAILVGIKRGILWGVGTFGFTVGWMGLFTLLLFLVLFVSRRNTVIYPQPLVPMTTNSTDLRMPAVSSQGAQ